MGHLESSAPQKTRRTGVIVSLSITAIVALAAVGLLATVVIYADSMLPGTMIGSQPVGGLTLDEARDLIHRRADVVLDNGLIVTVEGATETIPLRSLSPDDPDLSRELVFFHTDKAVENAFAIGHTGHLGVRIRDLVRSLFQPTVRYIPVELETATLEQELVTRFAAFYDPPVEPTFAFTYDDEADAWNIAVTETQDGRSFDVEHTLDVARDALERLEEARVTSNVRSRKPLMSRQEAARFIPDVFLALEAAPYMISYAPTRWESFTYTITADDLAAWLQPVAEMDGDSIEIFVGSNDAFELFLDDMERDINIAAQDARFRVEGNRVLEFKPSKEGRAVARDATREAILNAVLAHDAKAPIEPIVEQSQPAIGTGEVNDLGIRELLGVGTSNFKGSPPNRVKNIRHGANKLNGILIAPDEEFSLLAALRPFTIEDGYLSELVIKGDEIKPEVGGGLCQIGSTTFRAVMNAGLPVTARRNHSLVVSYYNDPTNGNPGTDATIYDPAPDFKFLNDTGNYVLLTTSMNTDTGELRFSFWGTSDGRKGYYSAPVVHNWVGAGETQTRYTANLPPGKVQCQGAHPGASASFTYTVERPDGEVQQTKYESYYRPLPKICLEGVEPERLDADGNLIEAVAPPNPEIATEQIIETSEEIPIE